MACICVARGPHLFAFTDQFCTVFPGITVAGLSTDVYENAGSVQICVNFTHGFLESISASIYYSTTSGSAVGVYTYYRYMVYYPWPATLILLGH